MVRGSPFYCRSFFTPPSKDSGKSDQASKRLSIFSVHVHPDGSRIATGGLDAKIRIWSTKPILNSVSEQSNRPPKSLCTLTMHTGPVLCVRWAHSGRWLASGSDDEIVMVWDLDPFVFSSLFLLRVFQRRKIAFAAPREARYGVQTRSMSRVGNR
jgi:WD40 repeat protein